MALLAAPRRTMTIPFGYGVAKIIWSRSGVAREFSSTIAYSVASGMTPNDSAEGIADSLKGIVSGMAIGPAHAPETGTDWTWQRVDVSQHDTGGIFDGSAALDILGSTSINSLGNQSCVLVRKRTGLGSKHGRGRMYLPPFWPTAALILNGSTISSDVLGPMQVAWNHFLANLTTVVGIDPVILPGAGGGALAPVVTSLEVEATIATQRKRLR
jgi:hypothetical protein